MIDNFIPIWYSLGMRGNVVYRILAAHPEVYSDSNISTLNIDNLATWLTISSKDTQIISTNINPWLLSYITYHTSSIFYTDDFKQVIKNWAAASNKQLLFTCVHPPVVTAKYGSINYIASHNQANKSVKITDKQFNLLSKSNPHIWVYGTRDRLGMTKKYFAPSTESAAYNLNIDALFSTDYATFETEYFKLIAHFNLTSCLNDIRAFILLVLERENYISKFY